MMNKEKKKIYIEEMKNFFNKNSSILIAHYQGLTVKQIDGLRSEMRKHGILFKITKNRITKLALEDSKFKKLKDLFTGPTAVALSEDAISSAKIFVPFEKGSSSNTPIGPFQRIVLLFWIIWEKVLIDLGPASKPCQPEGIL